jgi:hypothetical protein
LDAPAPATPAPDPAPAPTPVPPVVAHGAPIIVQVPASTPHHADQPKSKWEKILLFAGGGGLGILAAVYLVPAMVGDKRVNEAFIRDTLIEHLQLSREADVKSAEANEELADAVKESTFELRRLTEGQQALVGELKESRAAMELNTDAHPSQ